MWWFSFGFRRYWDHVGGETLDLALGAAAPFARFIVSTINSTWLEASLLIDEIMCSHKGMRDDLDLQQPSATCVQGKSLTLVTLHSPFKISKRKIKSLTGFCRFHSECHENHWEFHHPAWVYCRQFTAEIRRGVLCWDSCSCRAWGDQIHRGYQARAAKRWKGNWRYSKG